jgi:hypothetical protein
MIFFKGDRGQTLQGNQRWEGTATRNFMPFDDAAPQDAGNAAKNGEKEND